MPNPNEGICALVLSAGQGSRYRAHHDQDKLLAASFSDADSPPVLEATLTALRGVAERTVVVVRADNHPLRQWLASNAGALQAEVFAVQTNGLGHSLAQAVARFPARRGWLVALGDMPYVTRDSLFKVVAEINESNVVVPTFNGQRGHPRGIGTAHWAALLELDGDAGAQTLFSGEQPIVEVALDDPGVLQDIDRPGDRRSSAE
ncbi:molybdenum cofactor cytidylyltransferase [Halopseudomonas xinjiangensis]|uniref:Molybdenum cofactor cytidylyltransferase n=1 Tax=Halopseudomonas xinjiangensis TaxID=487184 RepID=A0A1H1R6P4_9GAMM|nr:nucleotidyltransferase family protein [Halopseudomonas xinjiangensis]SDS30619.1 molybdenum cofactor cytidylyltransferase [Halopseudomonas xinjiangensis]